jgi:hypothetical protein
MMPARARLGEKTVRGMTGAGMILPVAYAIPVALAGISGYFGRLDLLVDVSDLALLLSLPWELAATLLILAGWRNLTQRFWILYCVNGFLAYLSLPIYRMHFGWYG